MKIPLASPCTQVCQMDAASGWCRGCGRSLTEIAAWGQASESSQRHVLDQLPDRRLHLHHHGLLLGPWAENEETP